MAYGRLGLMACVAMGGALLAQSTAFGASAPSGDWTVYGHDPGGMRFSPLTQITPANVGSLKEAWVYHMRRDADPEVALGSGGGLRSGAEAQQTRRYTQSEVAPLVIDGIMFISTPYNRVVALDPTTGREVWSYSIPGNGNAPTRGLTYWAGDARSEARILFPTSGDRIIALNPKTGQLVREFGNGGVLGPAAPAAAAAGGGGGGGGGASSPLVIVKDVIVSGSQDPFKDDGRGREDIRGFDVRTGKQLWRFDTIPKQGQFGRDTWETGADGRAGSHVWGLMTVDAERGIVYAPINAPNWNRYGGDRLGNNLFSSSIVALDGKTGKRLWHFQVVHHDIWDMDTQSPPTLFDVKQGGRTIPAIGITNKTALLFILDRTTGKPIHPVEERPVTQSKIPGERTAATQPFPVVTPPLTRVSMTKEDLAKVTPELEASCKKLVEDNNVEFGGPYTPPGWGHPTVNFPGPNGGVNWGGGAFSPQLGLLFINSQDLGQFTQIGPKGQPRQTNGVTGGGSGNTPGIPYDMIGLNGRFKDMKLNMMCNEPPWGRLTAVDVNTGKFAWQVPLGVTDSLPPEKQLTGRPSSGGPTVTASGVLFIGATDDSRFRAFDAKTGKELWSVKLAAPNHSVPVTYMGKDGKQYVVFPTTGGSFLEDPAADDSLRAFALP